MCRYGVLSTAPKNYSKTNAQYCAEHGLVLQGEQPLPEAYQTFESVGFPHDILDEVCSRLCRDGSALLRGARRHSHWAHVAPPPHTNSFYGSALAPDAVALCG